MAAESSSYVTLETLVCAFIWQKREKKRKRKKRKEKKQPKRSYEICCPANNRDAPLETFLCKCYKVSR